MSAAFGVIVWCRWWGTPEEELPRCRKEENAAKKSKRLIDPSARDSALLSPRLLVRWWNSELRKGHRLILFFNHRY